MRVLIVGVGSIASKHIVVLRKIFEDLIVYALRSNNRYNISGLINVNSISELKDPIDFVIISNPTSLHLEAIKEVIFLKAPLFIEKPMASQLNDAIEMHRIVTSSNARAYIAYPLRFHPLLVQAKVLLSTDNVKIQEVNIYNGSYLPLWRKDENYRLSYSSDPQRGGGVHLDMSHELDLAYWLFGKPIKQVAVLQSKSNLQIASIDYANYILEYSSFSASIILNYYRTTAKRVVEIVTIDSIIKIDIVTNQLMMNGEVLLTYEGGFSQVYENQFKYFLELIKHPDECAKQFDTSLEVMKSILTK